jgi:uncharacterized protein with HEPN domain
MTRSVADYLADMLNAMRRAQRYVGELDPASFAANEMAVDATVRTLEIIGEAAKQVPVEVQERESSVPWCEMARMRDRVIHGYHSVDPAIVWRTVREVLPNVEPLIARALERQREVEEAEVD